MGPRIRLRAGVAILVAAGAIGVAVGVALLLINTVRLRDSADATLRSDNYLVSVINVERLVVDAETGLRGYVITGHGLFLAPLRTARAQLPRATTVLVRAAAKDQSFQPQAEGLAQSARSYLTTYVSRVLSLAVRRSRSARSFATTLEGKRLVDVVRSRTAALERLVSARQDARQRAARSSASHSIAEAVVILVLLTVLTVLVGLVLGRLAVARDHALEGVERTNLVLQRSLLPRALPAIPGCELGVRFRPAGVGELVGGDFYDIFSAAPNHWAIVIGDVCGKGAEAAAVTAMARWTLRSRGSAAADAAEALRALNRAMLREDLGISFITVAYSVLTIEGGRARVSIACGGHPPPVLVPVAGEPRPVAAQGTLLGVWPDIELHVDELDLAPGDALVAYTDGVTDQGPGIHVESPAALLQDRTPETSAEGLASLLEARARQRYATPRDDVAIVALRFTGTDGGGTADAAAPSLVQALAM